MTIMASTASRLALRTVQLIQLGLPGYRANQLQLREDHGPDHRYLPLVPGRIELDCHVARREPWMEAAGAGRVALLACPDVAGDRLLVIGSRVFRLSVYGRGAWTAGDRLEAA